MNTAGFRQRRAEAQEIESTTHRKKTLRLLNTLEVRLCMRNTVADRIML
jgi:hypothetical protein